MSAIFRCQHCGCVSEIANMLPAFEENPHCRQCGLSVSESEVKVQDELASMMARNLRLNTIEPPQDTTMSNPPTPQVVQTATPITYISQHYHHSTHNVPTISAENQVTSALLNAGIDAAALLPSQLQLYRNAQPDQQQRLVELWRIAPPTYGNQLQGRIENWPQTSMEQEEAAAHARWLLQEEQRSKVEAVHVEPDRRPNAEPYMANGYSEQANMNNVTASTEYKTSTDPVYQHSREWWHVSEDQPIEHQYGMLQQMMHY